MVEKTNGLLKVFISSTFRDLKDERQQLFENLNTALTPLGMEFFIPDGKTSQEIALLDSDQGLKNCDIVIFLISPYYGSFIDKCSISECKADCPLKKGGTEKISYTHCEYKFAKAEKKPYLTYLYDEKTWNIVQPFYQLDRIDWDTDNPLFKEFTVNEIKQLFSVKDHIKKFKKELESDFCSKIEKDQISIVTQHLADNIVKWYYEDKIHFKDFCGRKQELKTLYNKTNESVEVYGVGGIGKTTLIHIALLLQMLKGKKIFAIGKKQSYLSGSGYTFFKEKCRDSIYEVTTNSISINDVIDALKITNIQKIEDLDTKISLIVSKIEDENYLIFIDDFHLADAEVKKLVKNSNNFIISSKRTTGITRNEIPLMGICENERSQLIELITRRFGKNLSDPAREKILKFSEGHPVTIEILVRNYEKINFEKLDDYKKDALDFSNPDQVEEFLTRVIEGILSKSAFALLEHLAVINTEIESNINSKVVEKTYNIPQITPTFFELIDAGILKKKETMEGSYQFSFKHIQDAIRQDNEFYNKSAMTYYENKAIWLKNKWLKNDVNDEIEKFYHSLKTGIKLNPINKFKNLYNQVSPSDYGYKHLIDIGYSLINMPISPQDKSEIYHLIGILLSLLNRYKDAKEAFENALFTLENCSLNDPKSIVFQTDVLNSLGNLYINIKKFEKAKDCYEQSLEKLYALESKKKNAYIIPISMHLSNLGIVYASLNRSEDAEDAYLKALKIRKTLVKQNPMLHLKNVANILHNLAILYESLDDFSKSLNTYKESIKIAKLLAKSKDPKYQLTYARTLSALGSLYSELNIDPKAKSNFDMSLDILKDLIDKNLDAYLPDYVICLQNYAEYYRKTNDYNNAKLYAEDALNLGKVLVKKCPGAYNSTFASILQTWGNMFSDLNRPDLSLSLYYESFKIYAVLEEKNPGIFAPELSHSLGHIGTALFRLNRYADAETKYLESIEIQSKLNELYPNKYVSDYSNTRLNLGVIQEKMKRYDEAEKSYAESLENFRTIDHRCNLVYRHNLIIALENMGKLHAFTKKTDFVDYMNVAVDYCIEMQKKSSDTFTPILGKVYSSFGYCYISANDLNNAEKFYNYAVVIQRKLVDCYPEVFNSDLAESLNNLGKCKIQQQFYDEAEPLLKESISFQRELVKNCSNTFNSDLAESLNNLGKCKIQQQFYDDAEPLLKEALHIQKELVFHNPNVYDQILSDILNNLGILYFNQEQFIDAKSFFEQSLTIRYDLAKKFPIIFKNDCLLTLQALIGTSEKILPSEKPEKLIEMVDEISKL